MMTASSVILIVMPNSSERSSVSEYKYRKALDARNGTSPANPDRSRRGFTRLGSSSTSMNPLKNNSIVSR
ncbi:hypothetical protein D3C73_1609300 [compost metagenome]